MYVLQVNPEWVPRVVLPPTPPAAPSFDAQAGGAAPALVQDRLSRAMRPAIRADLAHTVHPPGNRRRVAGAVWSFEMVADMAQSSGRR
jgi:hypothetical protein